MEHLSPTLPLQMTDSPQPMASLSRLCMGLRDALSVLAADTRNPCPSATLTLGDRPLPYILEGWTILRALGSKQIYLALVDGKLAVVKFAAQYCWDAHLVWGEAGLAPTLDVACSRSGLAL
ncbi:hypothetical protein MMC07_005684 [Pseudocyphellaria aurata]|nr:hypothetical protein [Pseudocyphellaria aurata]